MGLFDILKKKHDSNPNNEHAQNKCAQCLRPIEGQAYTFEMRIADIFYIANRGVVLEGIISKGTVGRGDTVRINETDYTVVGIALNKTLVESAKESDCIGLLINSQDKNLFHIGEVVYGGITDNKDNDQKDQKSDNAHNFCLGTFSFTEEDRQKLKVISLRYMPLDLNTAESQLVLLKTLSLVMDVSVVELKTELSWKIPDEMSDEKKKEHFTRALVETILSVNQTLSFLNPDFLTKKVDSANDEELLKSWIVLDYYAHALKPEYTPNIQHFRDYIHSVIQTKFPKVNLENAEAPVRFDGTNIYIDSNAFLMCKFSNVPTACYELNGILPLENKEPFICLYEDEI